jgi:peptidoglycan/LPS O-acetylase OafA/YrhL
MSGNHGLGYLPHIDGVRAIAILSVVAYHAGVPGVSGGFVGVDVFFVISGFLIISQLTAAAQNGTLSLKTFWLRRALRILPAYLLVAAVTACASLFVIMVPTEVNDLGWQLVYASLMVVNHLFIEQQGYFDLASERKPLLHLWSLSVEEQFYIASPIVVAVAFAARKRWTRLPLAVVWGTLFALSLFLCVELTRGDDAKPYGFYLMVTRAWEFMVGGALGAVRWPRLSRWAGAISAAGLVLAAATVFGYEALARYPSFYAAGPVLAAACLIAGGLADPANRVALTLASRPLVAIGLVSYAWYLWHWPAMTLARIANFNELPLWLGLAMAALSLALAAATYIWIEKPVRTLRRTTSIGNRWSTLAFGVTACVMLAGAGMTIHSPVAARLEQGLPAVLTSPSRGSPGACIITGSKAAERCRKYANGKPILLLLGDSHAMAQYRATSELAETAGQTVALVAGPGCIGLFDTAKYNADGEMIRRTCLKDVNAVKHAVQKDLHAENAIIVSRWQYVTGRDGVTRHFLGRPNKGAATNQKEFFVKALRQTVAILKSRV